MKLHPRAGRDPFPFNHLSLKLVAEFENLDRYLKAHGKLPAKAHLRYAYLFERRVFPSTHEIEGSAA